MKNTAVELHDSTLGSIVNRGNDLVISLPEAYVYASDGDPGRDPSIVCSQSVEIRLADAAIRSAPTEMPVEIGNGHLRIGERLIKSMIPAPLAEFGEIELSLELNSGENLFVIGSRVELSLIGEGRDYYDWP